MKESDTPIQLPTRPTREELLRRLEESRRRKRELIESIKEEMRADIKARTGEDVTSFTVWFP